MVTYFVCIMLICMSYIDKNDVHDERVTGLKEE